MNEIRIYMQIINQINNNIHIVNDLIINIQEIMVI